MSKRSKAFSFFLIGMALFALCGAVVQQEFQQFKVGGVNMLSPLYPLYDLIYSRMNYDRDCRINGVKADGVTDDSAAVNNCIAQAVADRQSTVVIPCGRVWHLSPINLTNIQGLDFTGCTGDNATNGDPTVSSPFQRNNTEFLCNTGGVCFDRTGSSSVTISRLNITTASNATFTSPGTLAILDGRDNAGGGGSLNPFCFSQFNGLDRVFITMHHSATANSNNGTIGVYNVNAEHYTLRKGFIQADVPEMFLASNVVGVSSPYQTLQQAGCPSSMTLVTSEDMGVRGVAASGGMILMQGVNNFHFINQYVAAGTSETGPAYTISGGSPSSNIFITGQIENLNPSSTGGNILLIGQNVDNVDLRVSTAATSVCSVSCPGWISFDTTGRVVSNSRFRVYVANGQNMVLFQNANETIQTSTLDIANTTAPSFSAMTFQGVTVNAGALADSNVTMPASAIAMLFANNTVASYGSHKLNGGVVIGSAGTQVNTVLDGTATLTYTAIAAQTGQEQTVTVTGASTTNFGASCSPRATLGNANLTWQSWVSATNTVSVRVVNPTASSNTPSAVAWGCTVVQ